MDEASGEYYFYNKQAGESSWEKPRLLGAKELRPEIAIEPTPRGESEAVRLGREPEPKKRTRPKDCH